MMTAKILRRAAIGVLCAWAALPLAAIDGGASAYTEADLVWKDDFDGDRLNMRDWNYEYHAPGWVNNELQEYVDAGENVYVRDGTLVIQAVKKTGADGKPAYTSGRVNTRGKHDFTYGRFEARLKVPSGKGFLPAFWMMPTDENLYGQWPKCGEFDIMEVLGDATSKAYGTVHFGEPYAQRQGKYALSSGDFSGEFHTFAVEWEPGAMRFYVDGNFYYKTGDWFTKRNGFGEVTYPAPFDQDFYMILNLAVGGNWPGNPDDSTKFGENARLVVDYVKVYQKKEYDENVEKPAAASASRKVDANGNYVTNPNFASPENLSDGAGWDFLVAGKGKATAEISGGALNILTADCGELDYSVQVVQPNLFLEKGCKYRYSFDAWSDAERTILPAITAPNVGWIRYFPDTKTTIGPERKTYSFEFTMRSKDDPTARVEFNLGNQGSTASVHITNVSVVMTRDKEKTKEAKAVLPDGNYVYNGEFQEGTDRLDSWTVVNDSDEGEVTVSNEKNVRELTVVAPAGTKPLGIIAVSQGDLALKAGVKYVLSFDAYADAPKTVKATVAGNEFKIPLTTAKKSFKNKFTVKSKDETQTLSFLLGAAGVTRIDNVRVQEDALVINGSFSAGMTGYEVYAHEAAKVDYAVDTLSEDGAFCANVARTGDQDWMIQLKQGNITLEKGKWYTLSFDAKSTLPRTIMYALQRDGSADDNWLPYSGTQKIEVAPGMKRYGVRFQMTSPTDAATILSVSMGAVNGAVIDVPHTVALDNFRLEETKK